MHVHDWLLSIKVLPGTLWAIAMTAVTTAVITLIIQTFGAPLLKTFAKPFSAAWRAIYDHIAPYNIFSLSLRSYKRHLLRSDLAKIEVPVGPKLEVPLETAFAPLKLISGPAQRSIELFDYVSDHPRFIVLGGPGTGKTTLMKSLIMNVAKGAGPEALQGLLPVFITLRRMGSKGLSVRNAIIDQFSAFDFPGADRFIDAALGQGRMLIILDGLDEVGSARRSVVDEIKDFCSRDATQSRQNRVMITCRESSYRTEDLREAIAEVVRVEPFSNHHMRIFLMGWPTYNGRSTGQLYSLLQTDAQIRDICRTPLLLTILAGLFLETDNFELPSSRDRFYKECTDELLIRRPERKATATSFHYKDKRRILEGVSLDRLLSTDLTQDPEEMTSTALRTAAERVLPRDFDLNALIAEFVEVNGILKESADDVYVFCHRTIQEYFAARQVRSEKKPEEVLALGTRSELIEVLCFYSGMVENIPTQELILAALCDRGDSLLAARCLVNMALAPSVDLISRISDGLSRLVQTQDKQHDLALDLLSSLAVRNAPAYQSTRPRLSECMRFILDGYGAQGPASLCSALAAKPQTALEIIPALLAHPESEWRAAAYTLLRDIGTGEALDLLMQAIHPNSLDQTEAARVVAGLIRTRNQDVRQRAALLPDRSDPEIWPLGHLFPSRIALPLVEALVNSTDIKNRAIGAGVFALRTREHPNPTPQDQYASRPWRTVARDFRRRERKELLAARISQAHKGMCHLSTCIVPSGLLAIVIAISFRLEMGGFVALGLTFAAIIATLIFRFKRLRPLSFYAGLFFIYLPLIRLFYLGLFDTRGLPESQVFTIAAAAAAAIVGIHLFTVLIRRLNWPKNPFFDVLEDLAPLRPEFIETGPRGRVITLFDPRASIRRPRTFGLTLPTAINFASRLGALSRQIKR